MTEILIVEDDPKTGEGYRDCLQEEGYRIHLCATAEEGEQALVRSFDLAILDLRLGGPTSGLDLLYRIRRHQPETPVIMISGAAEIADALEAVRAGAWDFLEKPVSRAKLRLTVRNALSSTRSSREASSARADLLQRYELAGDSPGMVHLREQIQRVAASDLPVLILGETGTGKELVAHQIHYRSARWSRPIIRVNCAALAESLLEAELFGHTRGAFTGAVEDRDGLIAAARGGTLFLDEIGDMPATLQAALLRVLESGEYCRIGETQVRKADFRLVCATHMDLVQMVKKGTFRGDLYYRIAGVTLQTPPLRERPDDIQPLARRFLRRFCETMNQPLPEIPRSAWETLRNHPFPGNVRELRQIVERSVVLTTPGEPFRFFLNTPEASPTATDSLGSLREVRKALMRDYLHRRLAALDGDKKALAAELGIHVNNLYRLLRDG